MSEKEKRVYTYTIYCSNCGNEIDVEIPYGVTVNNYKASHDLICDNCGCRIER